MRSDKGFESIIFHLFFSIRIVAEFSETERQNLCCELSTGTFSPPFTVTTGETIIPHVFRVVIFHHRLPYEGVKFFSTNMCRIERSGVGVGLKFRWGKGW